MDAEPADGLAQLRSLLFVPGTELLRIRKAASSGADAVIVDLEDSVPVGRKSEAREIARAALDEARPPGVTWILRVNSAESDFFAGDLALAGAGFDALLLPKATPAALDAIPAGAPPVVSLVETALGLARVEAVAGHPCVERLMLGAIDLARELDLQPREDGLELLHPRATTVLASAIAHLPAPIDAVFPRIDDLEGLRREAELARSLGFGAKACIHPSHVGVINDVFTPTAQEVGRARAVLEAYEAASAVGAGVVQHEGAMIDLPVVDQARRTLARGSHAG